MFSDPEHQILLALILLAYICIVYLVLSNRQMRRDLYHFIDRMFDLLERLEKQNLRFWKKNKELKKELKAMQK